MVWETVNGCREVQEDEDGDKVIVCSDQEVIGDFDMGGFSTMMGSEAGLERFKELMVGHVVLEHGSHCSFQDLTQEGKVGDRAVIVGVIWVQARLFECLYHGRQLEVGGYHARAE